MFSTDLFMRSVSTAALGHVLLSAATLPSTQTLLQGNNALIPSGAVCVADRQQAGKGAALRGSSFRISAGHECLQQISTGMPGAM